MRFHCETVKGDVGRGLDLGEIAAFLSAAIPVVVTAGTTLAGKFIEADATKYAARKSEQGAVTIALLNAQTEQKRIEAEIETQRNQATAAPTTTVSPTTALLGLGLLLLVTR